MIYHENGIFTFNHTLSFHLPNGICLNNEAEGEMNDSFELNLP